jgi:hypothetical protein
MLELAKVTAREAKEDGERSPAEKHGRDALVRDPGRACEMFVTLLCRMRFA